MPTQVLSQRTSLKVYMNLLRQLLHLMLRHLSCYVRLVHLARVPYLEAMRFLDGNASAQSCNDFEQYCRELGPRGKLTRVIFHRCALEASRLHMVQRFIANSGSHAKDRSTAMSKPAKAQPTCQLSYV